ncbi:MAG: energy transducer TonB [Acidobacteriota bacterium]
MSRKHPLDPSILARKMAIILALGLSAGALWSPAPMAAQDAPGVNLSPMLIESSSLYAPMEASGTDIRPELKVRVQVNPRGKVSEVEILGIQPTTAYDHLFVDHTRSQLSRWRYAPALENGEPVAATLEWTVSYKSFDETSPSPPQVLGGTHLSPWATSEAQSIAELDRSERLAFLRRHAEYAETLLDPRYRSRFDTPRFTVVTDVPDEKLARQLATEMESVFNALDAFVGDRISPRPQDGKIAVFVFANKDRSKKVRRQLRSGDSIGGTYSKSGLMVLDTDVLDPDFFQRILLFQTTRAYLDRHLERRGVVLPAWIEQGFTWYISNARIKEGAIVPGKIQPSRWALSPFGGAYRARSLAESDLDRVKGAVRDGRGISPADLLDIDSQTNAERPRLYFPTAWLFSHYLCHGEKDWFHKEFPRFLLYAVEGYPADVAFEQVYGRTPDQVAEEFERYVKRL